MKVHFVGIGGIGVSALAKYYLEQSCQITGSDLISSEITKALKKLGAEIFTGAHKFLCARLIEKHKLPDLVIYSPAIPEDNPELKEARRLRIKCLSYPEVLGELTKKYFTIAVSGTHGKSTTTAMIGILLEKAGFDPTVIVGTKLKEFGNSNCRVGKSKYLVIEADEHMASFLNYWPKIIVLTSIEADHLDYYKNLSNILKTFKKYLTHLPKEGLIIANKDDKNIYQIVKKLKQAKKYYSLKQEEAKKIKKILRVPGKHNISNALAALTLARILKIPDKVSFKALAGYKSSWRRFEVIKSKINKKPITIISDYGHHPTEIKATLKATREKYSKKKILCIYQPHQHQRTYYLFEDFVKIFKAAPIDKLIITDIYDVAGREEGKIRTSPSGRTLKAPLILKKEISSEKLVEKVKRKNVIYLPKEKLLNYLKKNLIGGEVLIIMGAGDIYELTVYLTEKGRRKKIK